MTGKLVLVGTPIGNLEDMSPRGRRTLADADVVACEDTRRTKKLLTHFGIRARELVTYNEANERRRAPELVKRISQGAVVALVSDAGMPGLSDPGFRLVRACTESDFVIEIVPGPSAAISALAISGIAPARFVFEGFLPRKQSERRRRIGELRGEQRTLVLYESPHRIADTLSDLADLLGPRPAALARELTKMFEEVRRADLTTLAAEVADHPPRGEIVLVVEGSRSEGAPSKPRELAAAARELMESGVDRREALAEVARLAGVPRREVFNALIEERD